MLSFSQGASSRDSALLDKVIFTYSSCESFAKMQLALARGSDMLKEGVLSQSHAISIDIQVM